MHAEVLRGKMYWCLQLIWNLQNKKIDGWIDIYLTIQMQEKVNYRKDVRYTGVHHL